MAYTRKQAITKKHFKLALLDLLKSKSFNDITIKDITETAEYDRSSFYRYFDDKYQLLENIEDDLISGIEKKYQKVFKTNESIVFDTQTMASLLSMFDNPSVLSTINLLLGNNGDRSFEPKLNRMFAKIFYSRSQTTPNISEKNDLIGQYLAGLFIQTVRYKSSPHPTISTEQLAVILNDIYFNGFVASLHNHQK
ncbi:bacterial regulatory protein, tetR family [Lentilactobacillus sunkii]|jgi:AcrR family transcriptional regulator|uniref:Bacterial regulatory protein, tetR family n=1 Tax=Lentilactobacillus sunkii TaxID=481719 RepID=A0A1E7XGU5_9LACO|nr:TetR/AcrR family transcriptional regulator [Lentilactobacillus sunkii]OFA12248.1 bacterial regulatory protein, tetR family [Lentilactobacillus sunkii]